MGKGDKKTRKGKIYKGTYGKKRLRKKGTFGQAKKQEEPKK